MDKDSTHTSKTLSDFASENKLNFPDDWPASSPDLNPIENAWGRLAMELEKISPQNIDDLKKSLKTIWKRTITLDYCHSLVDSMKNRLQQVIDRNGIGTDY